MGLFKRVVEMAAQGDSAEKIAGTLGVSVEWVERVMGADGFQEAVNQHQGDGDD